MTVLRKSTVRPCPSVSRPSSSSCSSALKTSGCAFSTSSNRITWYGRRRTASVSSAALVVADVAGRRTDQPGDGVPLHVLGHVEAQQASSSSNRNSASALASSVLPTPVGPRNRKQPMGRFGSLKPGARRVGWRRPPPEGRHPGRSPGGAARPPSAAACPPRLPASAPSEHRSSARRRLRSALRSLPR